MKGSLDGVLVYVATKRNIKDAHLDRFVKSNYMGCFNIKIFLARYEFIGFFNDVGKFHT